MTAYPKIYIIGYGEDARRSALEIATSMRFNLFNKYKDMNTRLIPCVEVAEDNNIKKQLSKANKGKFSHAVILKDSQAAIIKDMSSGEQKEMPSDWLSDEFCRIMEAA